jgi:superfamily II DNA or RNA helicase
MSNVEPWSGAPWTPRRWQRECLPILVEALRESKRPVVSAVMGSGKSILQTELAWLASPQAAGRAIVFVVPSQHLVRQLASTMRHRLGRAHVGMFYADTKEAFAPVVICCAASLAALQEELVRRGRTVSLLVIDECHKSEAEQVLEVVPKLSPLSICGFTATPFRSVETESLSLFTDIVYRYTLADALQDKVLVPFRVEGWNGDGEANTDRVCTELISKFGQGPGIVSALDINDAEAYAQVLTAAGISAEAIHSRLARAERDARIEALRKGELRALVHVSLLAEGVDFPWLRWLCMRRPVSARVRFMQELGRVLRSCEGKSAAIVIDPHDLVGTHGLQHAAALGAALEEEARKAERKDGDGPGEAREMPEPVAIAEATRWARALLLALQAAGLAPQDQVQGRTWRTRRPTDRQVEVANRMKWATRYLPADHREAVKVLIDRAPELQRGAVSDLLSTLFAVADASKEARANRFHWKFPSGLEVPPAPAGVVEALRSAAA